MKSMFQVGLLTLCLTVASLMFMSLSLDIRPTSNQSQSIVIDDIAGCATIGCCEERIPVSLQTFEIGVKRTESNKMIVRVEKADGTLVFTKTLTPVIIKPKGQTLPADVNAVFKKWSGYIDLSPLTVEVTYKLKVAIYKNNQGITTFSKDIIRTNAPCPKSSGPSKD